MEYMKILLLYATNSGGTEMAASTIVQHLPGHEIDMKRASEASFDDLGSHDAIILGSPSWDFDGKEGQPHDDFWMFKKQMDGKTVEGKKFAIFGLGDSSYKIFTGAVDELEKWVSEWKGNKVVDSLRMDKFFYKQAENMQAIDEWCKKLMDVLK